MNSIYIEEELRVLIVDSLSVRSQLLLRLIRKAHPNVKVNLSSTVTSARKHLNEHNPNTVFISVTDDQKTTLDTIEEFNPAEVCTIVLCDTEKYAFKALKMSVVDYLIYPITYADLQNTFKKIYERLSIVNLLYLEHQKYQDSLEIQTKEGVVFAPKKDIVRIEVDSGYTFIHLINEKKVLSNKPLSHWENLLHEGDFMRINRKDIINLNYITQIRSGRRPAITLATSSYELLVADRRRKYFLSAIRNFSLRKQPISRL